MVTLFVPKSQTRRGRLAVRGKAAEDIVQNALENVKATSSRFDFERNYDSKSAGGITFQRRTGDFTIYHDKGHGAIEVKEVNHTHRLPCGNFAEHQVAKLRRREMAGADAVVLVRFMPDDVWRQVPIEVFIERPSKAGSWDLSNWRTWPTIHETPIFQAINKEFSK